MLQLKMEQIKGIFPRTTGWSKWAIMPTEEDELQTVVFPPDRTVVTIGETHFGPRARCSIHEFSGRGHWWNTLILDIPTGSSPQQRQNFVEELEPLTNVRPR